MKLPRLLSPYAHDAHTLFVGGNVGDIEFSGATYQVQIFDEGVGYWTFLQLGARGQLADGFCTCDDSERGCRHLAAAYLHIFNKHACPLHRRFERSLWNAIGSSYVKLLGDDPHAMEAVGSGHYQCETALEEPLVVCVAKTPVARKQLDILLSSGKKETEETSLKFSGLADEELQQWRQGRPPASLRYELSYWSDLAKWLMHLQESERYTIAFGYDKRRVPNRLIATFESLEVAFALPLQVLEAIIPTLATVDTPLAIHQSEASSLAEITYDPATGVMEVVANKGFNVKECGQSQHQIGSWWFVDGDGFYALHPHQLLEQARFEGEAICRLLHSHYELVAAHLPLHHDPVPLSYLLAFDEEWNLHVDAYLFDEGDLQGAEARLLGECAYLPGSGFFFVEERHFDDAHTLIPSDTVSDFVSEQRGWLNMHEGFETHLYGLEAELTYELTDNHSVLFKRQITLEQGEYSRDFGNWVYLAGQGFFSKVRTATGLTIKAGTMIRPTQVPLFIRSHRDELTYISHFFSMRCPIEAAELEVTVVTPTEIRVTPCYTFCSATLPLFFDDITYVEGEGFYELPLHLRLPEPFRDTVILKGKALRHFLYEGVKALIPYIKELAPSLRPAAPTALEAASVACASGGDRYHLLLSYRTAEGAVSLEQLWRAYKEGRSLLLTDLGFFDLAEPRYRWIGQFDESHFDGEQLTLTAMELLKLDAVDPIVVTAPQSARILDELRTFELGEIPPYPALKSCLRSYQQQGLCWLWFLRQHRLAGLLCDDMGLGKTHQAMALIAAIAASGELDKPILVICPTSVVYHWEEKLATYLPDIPAYTYHGVERSLAKMTSGQKILLTSYGVWRNDVEVFAGYTFALAIFDEVQIAKNHRSRTHKALQQVVAEMCIGMTGTPIENALRELKALFDLILPGYMPGDERFRDEFIKPIERYNDDERRSLLSRYVKPFILRRKKEDVLLDLPAKTEEVVHCALAPEQLDLYNATLAQVHRKLFNEIEDHSTPVPYIHIFAILTHLKQICDHPAVYYKDPDNYESYESGKWDLFVELFNEACGSKQKVVIFSQYLTMLDIFENYFKKRGIGYATIRGSTVRRGEQINRFNNDPTCEVFVGSLQAAGLGVDLTAASVVIHYDRWWNAARERQATDRVHRIGQQRGVQVFKLVTKHSFEERIDALILKKERLFEEVIGVDDHNFVKRFNRDELLELLQYIDRDVL